MSHGTPNTLSPGSCVCVCVPLNCFHGCMKPKTPQSVVSHSGCDKCQDWCYLGLVNRLMLLTINREEAEKGTSRARTGRCFRLCCLLVVTANVWCVCVCVFVCVFEHFCCVWTWAILCALDKDAASALKWRARERQTGTEKIAKREREICVERKIWRQRERLG